MVLKRSKHGLNTGCTLKFGPCIGSTSYSASTQTVLTKKQLQTNDSATDGWWYDLLADDGEIACDDGVQYSVNKHHRWRLQVLLCGTIDDIRRLFEQTDRTASHICRLVVVEEQLNVGRHACVGYHDSGQSFCHVRPRKRYSTASDLKEKSRLIGRKPEEQRFGSGTLHTKTRRTRKLQSGHNKHFRGVQRRRTSQRRWDSDGEEDREQEEQDHWLEVVEYKISTPQPVTARLQLNYQRDLSRNERKENKTRRRKNKMYWFLRGYSQHDFSRPSMMERWRDADLSDDEEVICEETISRRKFNYDLTPTKQHQYTEKHPRIHSAKRIHVDGIQWSSNTAIPLFKVHGKGTAIYEPRGSTSDGGEDSEVETMRSSPFPRGFSPSPRPPSLVCRLRADGLDPEYLEAQYGQHYTEGRCQPRRFTINTSWLHATRTTKGSRAKGREVILVFCVGRKVNRRSWVTDENCSVVLQDAVTSQYVRVQLESDLSTKQSLSDDLHTTFGSFTKVHCVDDVVQQSVRHLVRWPEERVDVVSKCPSDPRSTAIGPIDQRLPAVSQDDCLVNYINAVCGCNIRVYDSEWDVLADASARLEPDNDLHDVVTPRHTCDYGGQDRGVLFDTKDQLESSNYCDLCRKSIDNDVHGIPQCTALLTCRHWFCNECWKCHLAERVRLEDLLIICPGLGCAARVDHVTLLSLAHLAVYTNHTRHIAATSRGRSGDWQPCPRIHCGRLARLESPSTAEGVGVVCTCGATWCFRCRRKMHWPASCVDMAIYEHIVKQRRSVTPGRRHSNLPLKGGERRAGDANSANLDRSMKHREAGRRWTFGHIHKKITTIINYHKIISQRNQPQQETADLYRRTFDSLSIFAVQIHSVMECTYVFVEACGLRTRNRRLEQHVATLELLIDRMQRLLWEVRMDNIDYILTRLVLLKTQQKDTIKLITNCVKETRTELANENGS